MKAESGERTIPRGVRIRAEGLTQLARGGAVLLDGVSLVVEPGELVAIAGGSGAGKTTLLEILAGVRAPSEGRVLFDDADVHRQAEAVRPLLGYVPQDDIIHTELPLERTLRYAAALRLPPRTPPEETLETVREAMRTVGL